MKQFFYTEFVLDFNIEQKIGRWCPLKAYIMPHLPHAFRSFSASTHGSPR